MKGLVLGLAGLGDNTLEWYACVCVCVCMCVCLCVSQREDDSEGHIEGSGAIGSESDGEGQAEERMQACFLGCVTWGLGKGRVQCRKHLVRVGFNV